MLLIFVQTSKVSFPSSSFFLSHFPMSQSKFSVVTETFLLLSFSGLFLLQEKRKVASTNSNNI